MDEEDWPVFSFARVDDTGVVEFHFEDPSLRKRKTSPSPEDESQAACKPASRKRKSRRRDSGDTCKTVRQLDGSPIEMHMIFSQYEVVRTIFKKLSLQDLRSAAQVSSYWESVANIIFQSRTKLEWILMTSSDPPLERSVDSNLHYCDPKLCILFITTLKGRMCQNVYNHVGPKCPVLQVQGAGVVGTRTGTFVTEEVEESACRFGASALLLPAIPNVKYRMFHLNHQKLKKISTKVELTTAQIKKLTSIEPAEEVKCLLVFCGSNSTRIMWLLSSIQKRQTEKLVLGGGICSMKRGSVYGVAISGANVTAVSMLVPSTVANKFEVEEYFEKFQKDTRSIVAKQTVCFMFACVGRGVLMYGEPNIETSLFRKYFPSTPLVGYFGYGEIGAPSELNVPPEDESYQPSGNEHDFAAYLHDFSSVFVFLGFS